jgi:DNA-binding transcriptional MerR regulator
MEKEIKHDRQYLTQREVADKFRVSQSTVKNWRERGLLRYFQAPGSSRVLYPIDAVEELEQKSIKQKREVVKLTEIKRERPRVPAKPQKVWRV